MAFATNSSAFGLKPATSAFGSTTSSPSVFGATNTGGSLFGGGNTQQQGAGTSLFGQPANTNVGGGAFGSTGTNTANTGGGLFGGQQQQQQQQQPAQGGSLFGGTTTNNNTGGGLFGQNNASNTNTGGGLFGNTNNNQQQQQQGTGGGGLFGSTSNTGGGGLFGSTNTNTNTGGGGGLFGSSNTNTGGGLFGSTNTNTNTTGGGSLFGNNNNTANTNTGGGLFGQSSNTGNTGGGLFGQSSNTNTGGGLFGNANNQQQQQSGGGGLFGGGQNQQQGGGLFGGGQNQQQQQGGGLFGTTMSTTMTPTQQSAVLFTKASKFNDLNPDLQRQFQSIEEHINSQVAIGKELKGQKLGEEAGKSHEQLRAFHKDLLNALTLIRADYNQTKDLKTRTDQAVQDTIVAMRVVDAHKTQQVNHIYLRDHASFPYEYFTRITLEAQDKLSWCRTTMEQIERKLSSLASSSQGATLTPASISATIQAQHATFLALASTTAALDGELQKIKVLYRQLWRERVGSARDPFNELDDVGGTAGGKNGDLGLSKLGMGASMMGMSTR
ncbi:hypothetical protein CYLTODRAFT_438218 [Cylindrobasidium torrendii FP15055 ss-10]|uniref:Nucleoporin Nup54 alpha-helical domain-containing protein n=1 Tax=Cylindrobasidium torrendii FP15055 ss-10 TaxID=1314674 RepID=A0A0D7B2N7_9AGAR|nr:hypothetical protein CYLTODRAFT_438218 [Cylindrobasidium torrendii FP15055 ss-10]